MNRPTRGADGFDYYACSECHTSKIAALFTPEEIAGALRCQLCTGEIRIKRTKARRPTLAQQPRMGGVGRYLPQRTILRK